MQLTPWSQAYPNAKVIGPQGLPEKRAKSPEDAQVKFHTVITKENKHTVKISDEFEKDFEYELVDAHPNQEIAFYYKPDKTLIEADLMFNGPPKEQYSRTGSDVGSGWTAWMMNKLQGTEGTALGQKRLLWYGFSAKDRTGFNKSIKRINSWDFSRIIPCHGDVVESDGKGVFQRVFEWHLQAQD